MRGLQGRGDHPALGRQPDAPPESRATPQRPDRGGGGRLHPSQSALSREWRADILGHLGGTRLPSLELRAEPLQPMRQDFS